MNKHKLKVMTDFCNFHHLPLSACILAGRAWKRKGLQAAWASLEESVEAERDVDEAERILSDPTLSERIPRHESRA